VLRVVEEIILIFIHHEIMVAQANETGTSENMTNKKKKKITTVRLYTHKRCNIY